MDEGQKGYLNEYSDIVISTPKLLLSHLKLHSDNILKNINTFIVDEADLVHDVVLFELVIVIWI